MDALNPFVCRNLRWLLETQARARGSHPCLVWRDFGGARRVWTYQELLDDVDRLAAGLDDAGIAQGDRVLLLLENCPEFVLTWMAMACLGAVTVPVNTRSTAEDVAYYLKKSDTKTVVTSAALSVTMHALDWGSRPGERVFVIGGASGDARAGWTDFQTLFAATGKTDHPAVSPLAPAVIQFTSGTNSRPKGVVWTQANMLWAGMVSAAHEQLTGADRHLTVLPLFHTNAQSYSVLAALWAGATIVLMPRYSTSRFWTVVVEEQVTWCSLTWFGMQALLSQPVPEHHDLRCIGTGAVVHAWQEKLGVPLLGWWGMTETVSHGIVSDRHLPCATGAIGFPAAEYQLRVLSDQDGTPLQGPGTGALQVKGEVGITLALGYLDDPEANAAAWTDDGWFITGDRVGVNSDGSITFIERDKDVIRVGGENVAAQEVERVIGEVAGVRAVAAVAGPHPMLQEEVVAFVVYDGNYTDGEARIREACDAKLADFKRPRRVVFLETLPRGTLDKVLKRDLRARARALASL